MASQVLELGDGHDVPRCLLFLAGGDHRDVEHPAVRSEARASLRDQPLARRRGAHVDAGEFHLGHHILLVVELEVEQGIRLDEVRLLEQEQAIEHWVDLRGLVAIPFGIEACLSGVLLGVKDQGHAALLVFLVGELLLVFLATSQERELEWIATLVPDEQLAVEGDLTNGEAALLQVRAVGLDELDAGAHEVT